MSIPIVTVSIKDELDVVAARQRARQIARQLGLEATDQARLATAVSEIARNAFNYGRGGRVDFVVEEQSVPQVLLVKISDQGTGIERLDNILHGKYESQTGLGMGIVGARRLVDRFEIISTPGAGTRVWLRKLLPANAPPVTRTSLQPFLQTLTQETANPLDEIQAQNQELVDSLSELRARQDELVRLNRELEDTNRGVIALYAELDEKAETLRRADELKSRFLSNMSHEFRTPLNSIIALSRLLLERSDGDLTGEQEKQVKFIRQAAEDLSELVNDLLDLARVEAGKILIHPAEFQVEHLFGTLRGLLRPLLVNEAVNFSVEVPPDLPALYSDEAKVSQILRNLLSNALKFTEQGHVRLSAQRTADGAGVIFSVEDTGIGIAPPDLERIFQEFAQVDNPIQKHVRGTGLGLPLSKKLAELLGGSIQVSSQLGVGSAFSLTLPLVYPEPGVAALLHGGLDSARLPVLLIAAESGDRVLYERYLANSEYQLLSVTNLREARTCLKQVHPHVIILDNGLRQADSSSLVDELKGDPHAQDIPVLVVCALDDQPGDMDSAAQAIGVKPVERTWLLERLHELVQREERRAILVIDDEAADRYVLGHYLAATPYAVVEATTGAEGLRLARTLQPRLILLDLKLPDLTGYELLGLLNNDPLTGAIPVVIVTSKVLDISDYEQLMPRTMAIFSKAEMEATSLLKVIQALPADGRSAAVGHSPVEYESC